MPDLHDKDLRPKEAPAELQKALHEQQVKPHQEDPPPESYRPNATPPAKPPPEPQYLQWRRAYKAKQDAAEKFEKEQAAREQRAQQAAAAAAAEEAKVRPGKFSHGKINAEFTDEGIVRLWCGSECREFDMKAAHAFMQYLGHIYGWPVER